MSKIEAVPFFSADKIGTKYAAIKIKVFYIIPKKRMLQKEKYVTKKQKMKEQEHLSILVVDDEKEICKMFKKWLLLKGHQVKFASTGNKAIGLIKKENFDIVYLDIVMPGISGIEVFEKIRKIPSKTKIVLITGELLDNKILEELKQKGISKILKKPFKVEDVNATINSF